MVFILFLRLSHFQHLIKKFLLLFILPTTFHPMMKLTMTTIQWY